MVPSAIDSEKIFPQDILSKRERVERALNHQPLDRAPLLEQLSLNPDVIALYTGKQIEGFDYTVEDIGCATGRAIGCKEGWTHPKLPSSTPRPPGSNTASICAPSRA
jgi:hypothetical protein